MKLSDFKFIHILASLIVLLVIILVIAGVLLPTEKYSMVTPILYDAIKILVGAFAGSAIASKEEK